MADTYDTRCSRCRRLYSLGPECAVITLTFLHVMANTVELLVHLEVIQVPNSIGATDAPAVTPGTGNLGNEATSTVSTFDPGGEDCDYTPSHRHLDITVEILRYGTLVISALFLIEIFAKMIYKRKKFFTDAWQLFDLAVVLCSLGVEITFFVLHRRLLCVHPSTEVAGYIVVLRLWRLPRTCNIRKKEYATRLDNELVYLTKTKTETDLKYQYLQKQFHVQKTEAQKMLVFLSEQTNVDISHVTKSTDRRIPNGNGPPKRDSAFGKAIQDVFPNKHDGDQTPSIETISNGFIPSIDTSKNRNSYDVSPVLSNKVKTRTSHVNGSARNSPPSGVSRSTDAAIVSEYKGEADDVFMDSDSEAPAQASVQQVEVQIEDKTHQRQLPSISSQLEGRTRQGLPSSASKSADVDEDDVVLRRPLAEGDCFDNAAYVPETGTEGYRGSDISTADDIDCTRTYRSAEGIPMTEL